jgi:hypothetical protein
MNCDLCGKPYGDGQSTAESVICAGCCEKHNLKEERDKEVVKNKHTTKLPQDFLNGMESSINGVAHKLPNNRIHEGDGKKRCKTCRRRLPRNFVANHCSESCAKGIHPRDLR